MSLAEKTVIVTGGANGIGLACARRFGKAGAKVVIADLDESHGNDAADNLVTNGCEAIFVHCDVGEKLDVHNLIAAALNAFERIDCLVNCAGILGQMKFLDLEEDEFDRIMRTNVKGAYLAGQAVARQMVKQIEAVDGQAGKDRPNYSIVNLSSIGAVIARPDQVAYTVSQGALNQLTRVMAVSLAEHGIRVNAIGPGAVMTDMLRQNLGDNTDRDQILSRTPLGRIGDPDEIAAIASFLVSEEASYLTGQCIYADGGRLALNDKTVSR